MKALFTDVTEVADWRADWPLSITSFALFMLEAAVCDLIMVYRLWAIWSHTFAIIVVPAVTFVISLVFSFVYICNVARSRPSPQDLFSPPYLYWLLTSLACSVATNIYCTAVISYRVWRTQESVKHSRFTGSSTGRVSSGHLLGILVESAGIYTASMLLLLITYTVRSPISFLITDLAAPATGIAFALITVRSKSKTGLAQSAFGSVVSSPEYDGTDV